MKPIPLKAKMLVFMGTSLLFMMGITAEAQASSAFSIGQSEKKEDSASIEEAWKISWERFYSPNTHLFYDYISSYEKGKELSHLPTIDEIKRQYPNPCGYGTGMEDCTILTATMLETLVDKFDVACGYEKKELRIRAKQLLDGLKRCSLLPEYKGFVARGVSIYDGQSIYYNSSRDQYTHCVYGLWKFYDSPLADDSDKELIRTILSDIADRMIKNVTPENNYDFLRADNQPCPLGICRMWNVSPHEAARLPMIYAAAWHVTKSNKFFDLYRQYIDEAIAQSEKIESSYYSAYIYLQMMYSFDLLLNLETDSSLKNRLKILTERVGKMAYDRSVSCLEQIREIDKDKFGMLGPDWRVVKDWDTQKGYLIPRWGEYRSVWSLIREAGESALVVFMANNPVLANKEAVVFKEICSNIDYSHISSCGIVFHVAAYWTAKKAQLSLN